MISDLLVLTCGYAEKHPGELYYMDLLNEWNDTDGDGFFDQIQDHSEPVIWIGRLTAGLLHGNEKIDLLNKFTKNHDYRIGKLNITARALVMWMTIGYQKEITV